MKVSINIFLVLASLGVFGQGQKDESIIIEKVDLFFESLERQDSALFNSVVIPEGQIWISIKNDAGEYTYSLGTFNQFSNRLDPSRVIDEVPFSYEVKINTSIAMAWVPYRLSVDGKFSHCGVDIFTLVKTEQGWKISTIAFTMEPDGCDSVRN